MGASLLKWHHAFLREKSAAEYFDDLQSVYCCGAISSPKSAVVVPRARPPLGQGFNDSLTIGVSVANGMRNFSRGLATLDLGA